MADEHITCTGLYLSALEVLLVGFCRFNKVLNGFLLTHYIHETYHIIISN